MLPDRVSNPGPPTYESGALPIALRGPALCVPGGPVAQWLKRRPTDLAVASLSPARGEIFQTVNGVPLHTPFHYQPLIDLI